jgi:hypothetical protein
MQNIRLLVLTTALRAKIEEAEYTMSFIYYGEYRIVEDWYDPEVKFLRSSRVVTGFNVTVRPPLRKYPTHEDRKMSRKLIVPIRDKIPKALGLVVVHCKLGTRTNGEDQVILTTTKE